MYFDSTVRCTVHNGIVAGALFRFLNGISFPRFPKGPSPKTLRVNTIYRIVLHIHIKIYSIFIPHRVAGEESAEGGGVIAGAEINQIVRLGELAFAREAVGIVGCPRNRPHIAEPVVHIGYHPLPEGIRQLPHRTQTVGKVKHIRPAASNRPKCSVCIAELILDRLRHRRLQGKG